MRDRFSCHAPTLPATKQPRSKSLAVTVHDVARVAGVSIITVSRAVTNPDRVSAPTLDRVREAIARTGYVPNLIAGGLRSRRSKLVAAVVPSLTGGVFTETIESLTLALGAHDYHVLLGQAGFTQAGEDKLLDALLGRRPDGIVLTGVMHSHEGRTRLLASGIPVVETWDLTSTPIDMIVGFSHERLGFDVADFLLSRGRKKLGIVSGDDDRARQRNEGFCRAAARGGVRTPQIELVHSPTTHEKGRAGFAALLDKHPDLDGVFCGSDALAMGALTECLVRSIPVPEDISIVGHGDVNFAASLHPPLTTVRIDYDRIGRTAAQFIIDRAEGRTVDNRIVDIGYSIVSRGSA
ncbi:LacI family DNA-binding transcriptional regulator [Aquincola tertiaricarbonis]|uniref:LacI family DNA-binding transcriptional regulator n=1 Tax=Aquincola tertiaricarbonis TaxID=391953 RepID=UPI00061514AF|nr:LacI family DNA-binding transcriptional regulator [Aquincola tertiaricarbonis]